MACLDVFRDSEGGFLKIGSFQSGIQGEAPLFAYDEGYLAHATTGELGISLRMPLDSMPYSEAEYGPFFQGLLPEGDVVDRLVRQLQISSNDYLGMLGRLGLECIGALAFMSDGDEAGLRRGHYEHLTEGDVSQFQLHPLRAVTRQTEEIRLSLSGAQTKVAWMLPEGIPLEEATLQDWLVPRDTVASTHIVKITRPDEADLALNELVCLRLAAACGIPTVKACGIDGIPGAIAIERYDRRWIQAGKRRRVLRLHQEDFCQALGWKPYLKYEPEHAGVSYPAIVVARLGGAVSQEDFALEFARRTVFDYLIGNSDNHLKNHGLLWDADWTRCVLAPAYDLTCLPLTRYSDRMAFDIGSHRRLGEIGPEDFDKLARDVGVSSGLLASACEGLVAGLRGFDASRSDREGEREMADRILENAAPRMRVVKSFIESKT